MTRTTDPPVSEAQRRWAFANRNKSSAAKEFAESDPGGKLPEKVKDMTEIKPASGPMSTKGPSDRKVEGLPEAATPLSTVKDNSVGKGMSLQQIKDCYGSNSMDKRR